MIKYVNLGGDFNGYRLYFHDPPVPHGPDWALEFGDNVVCTSESWEFLLREPCAVKDRNYINRLIARCRRHYEDRDGEPCTDPENTMGVELRRFSKDWRWL